MDGRFLFAAAMGIALAVALQTAWTGMGIALGALRLAEPPAARAIGWRLGRRALAGACVPAFAAAWLAARIARAESAVEGLFLGLAVWAGLLMAASLSEAAGRVSWPGIIVGVFRRSLARFAFPAAPRPAPADAASLARIEAEARASFRDRGPGESLRETLKAFLDRLETRGPDRFEIDREADAFFDDEALREAARRGDLLGLDRGRFREMAASRHDLTADEVSRWAEAMHARWNALREAEAGAPSAPSVTDTLPESPAAPGSGAPPAPGPSAGKPRPASGGTAGAATAVAPGAGYRERLLGFKEFLRKADRSALNPDRLEHELAHLVLRGGNGQETVDKEARGLRREDVARELRQRRDISSREADSIADLIDSARARMLSRSEIREHRRQESTDQALARLRDRLYGLARPERDYAAFRHALDRLLEERLAAAPGVEGELKEFGKAELHSLFFSKQGISRTDADKMAETADAAFRAAEEEARRLRAEVLRRREEALLALETEEASARSLAASAARWLLAIAALSALAAAGGGWLGTQG